MGPDDEILVLITRLPLFLPLYALVLFRVTGLMIAAPVYGSQAVPVRIRVMLAAAIALVLFPSVAPHLPADVSLGSAVAGVFGELLIGLSMGLALTLFFVGIQVAGMVIGQQAGLGLGEVFNPVLNAETTILGQLFFLVALTVFVLSNGHRELMRALLDTYEVIPVLSFRYSPSMLDLLATLLTSAYGVALRLAGPVLVALLITTMVLGFLSRTIPQMNILSVGFVVRVIIALGVGGLSLSVADGLISDAAVDTLSRIRQAFGLP